MVRLEDGGERARVVCIASLREAAGVMGLAYDRVTRRKKKIRLCEDENASLVTRVEEFAKAYANTTDIRRARKRPRREVLEFLVRRLRESTRCRGNVISTTSLDS